MKPLQHAKHSVRQFGVGTWEDYIEIHDWLDQTKSALPDVRHRIFLHNSFGIYLAEQFFGTAIEVDGRLISVRAVAEKHILEDLGFIPDLQKCTETIQLEPGLWLGGRVKADQRTGNGVN